jgi:glycerol uptake facilitator-like aquaporin
MVFCCFTPGPYLGSLGGWEEWIGHFCGILLADYVCGGPHVNPAVSFAFFVWRKLSFAQVCVLWSAQMAGGIVAFPLLQAVSTPYGVQIGGPMVRSGTPLVDAMWAEFIGTFLLLAAVYVFCTTWLGSHWAVKQSLVAVAIRIICILNGGVTGPALNPMLGTTWSLFVHGSFPTSSDEHYLVYWVASVGGAVAATLLWSLVWGDGIFARGSIKAAPTTVAAAWAAHADRLEKLTRKDKSDPSWTQVPCFLPPCTCGGCELAVSLQMLVDYDQDAALVMSVMSDEGKGPSMATSKKGSQGFLIYLQSTRRDSGKVFVTPCPLMHTIFNLSALLTR